MKKQIKANMEELIDLRCQGLEVVVEIKEIEKILRHLIRIMIMQNKTRILSIFWSTSLKKLKKNCKNHKIIMKYYSKIIWFYKKK